MPLISYGPALGVGMIGEQEYLDFVSPEHFTEEEFLEKINRVMPTGMKFTALLELTGTSPSLAKLVNRAEYRISTAAPEIEHGLARKRAERPDLLSLSGATLHEKLISEFLSHDRFLVERNRKNRSQNIDLRKFVKTVGFEQSEAGNFLVMVLEITNQGGARPVEIANAIYGIEEAEQAVLQSRVRRNRLYAEIDGRDCSLLELR